ncbi:TPA: hypothetical protein QEM39_004742 [Pseudomonas putida]|uniref:hypothetical protein n=1 Tax=Pseudomonas TaxID=286 RepID=UPI0007615101|nr:MULTISPECIES: hypothetical protein [Pseudomonas]MDD2153215.1 hypothetical protein [Pseudomonas putida]HDS1683130.1 hypothetical protein [Pseudomonas putida]
MSKLPELEALILNLVGSGITSSMLRELVARQSPQVSRQELDAALVALQFSGALHQLHSEMGYLWAVGPTEDEFFERINPDVMEQILNPGEFVELDVDQLLAELDAMIVRARKK